MPRKPLTSLRERLGLPPPSPADVVRLHRDVEEVVRTVVNEDPSLRRWVEACRNVVGQKINCQRDVFGNCELCDRRFPR